MDELRSEIRAAFEKGQVANPPLPSLRRDVVATVTTQPRREPALHWVAVVAAVLIGLAVVAGLMSTRLVARLAPMPGSTPKATLVADYGPPRAGVPLLYVHDPNHASWLIGYDWSGNPRATVKLDPALVGVGMAPDGQSFAVGLGAKGGTGKILDRLGAPVPGTGSLPGSTLPIWADDNRQICGVSFNPKTFAWTLITLLPGQPVKSVVVIARDKSIGQTDIRLASCSVHNDQAILVRTTNAWPSELWVVRLSNGKIVAHNAYADSTVVNVVGSGDGLLIAENAPQSVGQEAVSGGFWTIVRRVSDKSVVATLDASLGILAFNSDDSLALVTTSLWVGGQPTHLAVIDLRTGQRIWQYDGPEVFASLVAQPGGRDFALILRTPDAQDLLADVVLVHGDGSSTRLPGRYIPTW
jgi:hypothetical protein